jgi:hypothetical protein
MISSVPAGDHDRWKRSSPQIHAILDNVAIANSTSAGMAWE